MKRVLLISNMFPSKQSPAFGVFVRNIYEQLVEADVQVQRSVIDNNRLSAWKKALRYMTFTLRTMWLCIRSRKQSVFYVHYILHSALPLVLLPWRPANRIVGHVHGSDVNIQGEGMGARLKRWVVRRFIKRADVLILPSEFYLSFLRTHYDCQNAELVVSPSGGINLSVFNAAKKTASPHTPMRFLVVSRLLASKGMDTLANAFQLMEDEVRARIDLTVVGSGPFAQTLSDSLCSLEFAGLTQIEALPQAELVGHYQSADWLIFPSPMESLGLVGLESMACGTPVIGALNSGLSDYLTDNENGLSFRVNEADSLASTIEKALNLSSEQYSHMVSHSMGTAREFDSSRCRTQLLQTLFSHDSSQ